MADYTLSNALAVLAQNSYWGGDTLYLRDGVYTLDSFTVGQSGTLRGCTIAPAPGARPVIVGSDGYPPAVDAKSGVKVKDLWFLGAKYQNAGARVVNIGNGSTFEGCTFSGYGQCIAEGSGYNNLYLRNRFVNCGYGTLYHDIYISNASAPVGSTVQENIHVGGQAYKIHLYHDPVDVKIIANFMAGSSHSDLAVQYGSHLVKNNILWGVCAVSYWNAQSCIFNKNIMGPDRIAFSDPTQGNTVDGNVYCNGQTAYGTNPQTWNTAAIQTNLGYTKAQIDTAVSNLITKFQQTPQQIHDDLTIESDFAVLRGVIDAWKNR